MNTLAFIVDHQCFERHRDEIGIEAEKPANLKGDEQRRVTANNELGDANHLAVSMRSTEIYCRKTDSDQGIVGPSSLS
jgi:hypothetical protein